jgi:hypothetical protein
VIGAEAPANQRRARALLCAAAALTGVALVALAAGRAVPRSPVAVSAVRVQAPPAVRSEMPALQPAPAVVLPPGWQPAVAGRVRRDDGAAPARPERVEPPTFARDDWRESVADALGREALEGLPRDPGAMHTHVHSAEEAAPDARDPALVMGATARGSQGLDGWDGGRFWFGPTGLVRMKEAQP